MCVCVYVFAGDAHTLTGMRRVCEPQVDDTGSLNEEDLNEIFQPSSGVYQANVVVGPGLYYIGIIDTLQTWSLTKRMERAGKLMHCQHADGISCVPPVREGSLRPPPRNLCVCAHVMRID